MRNVVFIMIFSIQLRSLCRANGAASAFSDDAKLYSLDQEQQVTPEPEEPMLDYQSYYPTMLPLRPPGSLAEPEDDSVVAALPTDLLSLEVSCTFADHHAPQPLF